MIIQPNGCHFFLRPYCLQHAVNNSEGILARWRRRGAWASLYSNAEEVAKITGNSIITTIIEVAGAGFRLSLLLNAVGMQMTTANREIQAIAKEISMCSLMLKQVGTIMDSSEVTASWGALETAKGIAMHSQTIFTEIKDMAEMSQQRDENGHMRSITIAGQAQSWFRKQRVQYLLGQLVSLKLSLSIMLQILQLGKNIARNRFVLGPFADASKLISSQKRHRKNLTDTARDAAGTSRDPEHGGGTTLVISGTAEVISLGGRRGSASA